MSRSSHRVWVPALLTLALTLMASVAFAYWTSTGTGAGTETSTTPAVLSITAGTPTTLLYPGASAAVVAKVTNSGNTDVRISSITLAAGEGTGGFDVDASHADCGLDDLAFTTQTTGWTVNANSTLTITMANSITMATAADNECQGATFTVHLRVAG